MGVDADAVHVFSLMAAYFGVGNGITQSEQELGDGKGKEASRSNLLSKVDDVLMEVEK